MTGNITKCFEVLRGPWCLKSWTNILLLERKSSKYIFLVLDSISLHAISETAGCALSERMGQKNKKGCWRVTQMLMNARLLWSTSADGSVMSKGGVWETGPHVGGGNEEGCFGCVEGDFFFFFNVECFFPSTLLFLIRKDPWESQQGADWICPRSNTQLLEGGEIKTPSFSSQPPRINITWWIFVPH